MFWLLSTSIIVYSILTDKYNAYGNFSANTRKIVFNYENQTYLLESGKLYKTNDLELSSFKIINNNTGVPDCDIGAYGILKDKSFYFVLTTSLYKFDFKTESITLLRQISI
jgi:hypothetical protein